MTSSRSKRLPPNRAVRPRRQGILLIAMICGIMSLYPVFGPACNAFAQAEEVWILVDTKALKLSVMQGDSPLRTFENIAIGSNGATWQKKTLDEKTPLGDFKISSVKENSRFHLFFALDYPTMEHARRALEDGRISPSEYESLQTAWNRGESPPQNTGLGGFIGIHGVGEGDMEVHNRFNWTNGCVAITNDEIDEMAQMVSIGTRVTIR